jgi:hypothetical protein
LTYFLLDFFYLAKGYALSIPFKNYCQTSRGRNPPDPLLFYSLSPPLFIQEEPTEGLRPSIVKITIFICQGKPLSLLTPFWTSELLQNGLFLHFSSLAEPPKNPFPGAAKPPPPHESRKNPRRIPSSQTTGILVLKSQAYKNITRGERGCSDHSISN